jgi:hypothetical protein
MAEQITIILVCDMDRDCKAPITHIDAKGYIYCRKHGVQRKASGVRCRQMTPAELKAIHSGDALIEY